MYFACTGVLSSASAFVRREGQIRQSQATTLEKERKKGSVGTITVSVCHKKRLDKTLPYTQGLSELPTTPNRHSNDAEPTRQTTPTDTSNDADTSNNERTGPHTHDHGGTNTPPPIGYPSYLVSHERGEGKGLQSKTDPTPYHQVTPADVRQIDGYIAYMAL